MVFRIILILLMPLSLSAQNVLSLKEAVKIGLEQNLNILISEQLTEVAKENDDPAMAGLYPVISANGSYTWQQGDQTQQLANQDQENTIEGAISKNLNASVLVSYILFDGLGNIRNYQKLGLQRELTETQLRFTIENTILQIFSSYYNASRQSEQLEVSKEAVALSLSRFKRAEIANELGSQSRLELLSARVDLNTDSINYLASLGSYQKSLRQLNQVLNLPIDTILQVDTTVILQDPLNYNTLREEALQNNAALIQSQYSREISKKNIAIARSDRFPEISGTAGYQYSRQENEGSFLKFTEGNGWQAGISARWDLFNGNRTKTQIEVARINLEKSDLELEKSRQQLALDLANAYLDYETNWQIFRMEGRNLELTRLNYERSEEAYKLGRINNTQLREAQLNYITSKARYNNLKYTLKISEIELKRIAGILIQSVSG